MGFLDGDNTTYYGEMRSTLEHAVHTRQIRSFKLKEPTGPRYETLGTDVMLFMLIIEPLVGRTMRFPLNFMYRAERNEGSVQAQEFIKRSYVGGPVPFIDAANRLSLCYIVIKMRLQHHHYLFVLTMGGSVRVCVGNEEWVGEPFVVPEIHNVAELWDASNEYVRVIESKI